MASSILTRPSSSRFTLMWANDTEWSQPMVRHTAVLRGVGSAGLHGLTCRHLYIDQITVVYRDVSTIQTFGPGDGSEFTWNLETQLLQVGVSPGRIDNAWVEKTHPAHPVQHAYTYSGSFTQFNTGQAASDGYYVRVYRPTRDMPVASNMHNVGNLQFHLLFPLIFLSTTYPGVDLPDYRVHYVVVELSIEE